MNAIHCSGGAPCCTFAQHDARSIVCSPCKLLEHKAGLPHVELPPSTLNPDVLHSCSLTAISCVVIKQQGVSGKAYMQQKP